MLDNSHYKTRLEQELANITEELKSIATFEAKTDDWKVKPEQSQFEADSNSEADAIEETEERQATLSDLEIEYRNIKRALEKIEAGTYGICEVDGTEIEPERLNFKPTARTCKNHMNDEGTLPM